MPVLTARNPIAIGHRIPASTQKSTMFDSRSFPRRPSRADRRAQHSRARFASSSGNLMRPRVQPRLHAMEPLRSPRGGAGHLTLDPGPAASVRNLLRPWLVPATPTVGIVSTFASIGLPGETA